MIRVIWKASMEAAVSQEACDVSDQPIRRALLSVSDKTGLVELGRALAEFGVELISTGGTYKKLEEAGLPVIPVEKFTGFPEMMGGRIKTLHPKVFAGLLARRDNPGDTTAMAQHNLVNIDLVVVNLYPFAQTIAKPGVTWEEAIEQIDIGGPSMLRAAAKNHNDVTVICDPADYEKLIGDMKKHKGATCMDFRRKRAGKVFAHTAQYDAMIAGYFQTHGDDPGKAAAEVAASPAAAAEETKDDFPPVFTLALPKRQSLRYGENPHQAAAFYHDPMVEETCLARAKQLHGKELSYNNLLDAEGALEAMRDFADLAPAAAVVVKHSNPCGIALGDFPAEAYKAARECDPVSAFGGIVALSVPIDEPTAALISETFLEVIMAPSYAPAALDILTKKKNIRLLELGPLTPKQSMRLARGIVGGLLVMDRDLGTVTKDQLKVVTKKQPTDEDLDALLFAWRCVKWVKSNAIVYTGKRATIGMGAGQMSRVDSAKFGVQKAQSPLQGCYMASDAFFPFRDSIDEAAKTGVKAIIEPGGSIRDEEVIQAADEHGLVMVFTGMRHFRH